MDLDLPASTAGEGRKEAHPMTRIWYCPNCGYEMTSRGRCHQCRQRLVASALPELPAGDDDEEVGYRLDGWADRDRGRLIERLNLFDVDHRFEGDELVVAAEKEAQVDDLVAELAANPDDEWLRPDEVATDDADRDLEGAPPDVGADWETPGIQLLADAARRLRADPTDMHADADVAEASAVVFMADRFEGTDGETWAAVGRVTRRLLSALGADEALDSEIREQAAILDQLLAPALGDPRPEVDLGPDAIAYEVPEWLPEQRAQLSLLLDDAEIGYEWDGDDLVVAQDREQEVESFFDRVGVPSDDDEDDDGGEGRYRALEELFAAADRLAADPDDEQRSADTQAWIEEVAGPPPIGMDEIHWFRIMTQARTLSESIAAGRDDQVISDEAAALRDLLRTVV